MLLRHIIPTNNDVEEIYIVKQEDAPAGPNSNPLAAGGASGSSNQPLLLYENEDIEIKDEPLSVHGSDDEEYEDEKYEPPTPFLHAIPLEVKLVEDLPKKLEAAAIKKEPVDAVTAAAAAAAAVALTEVQPQRPKVTPPEKTDSKDSVELTLREKVKKEEDVSSDDDWGDDDCEPLAKQVEKAKCLPNAKASKHRFDSDYSMSSLDDDDDYSPPQEVPKEKKRRGRLPKKLVKEDEGSDGENDIKCYVCVAEQKDRSALQKHLKDKHKKMLPFNCNICTSRKITKLKDLNFHFRQHDETRRHKCVYCAARFESAQAQASHMRRMHSKKYDEDMEKHRRFLCRFCDKKFTKKHDHEAHEKRHLKESSNDPDFMKRELKCYICNDFVGNTRDELYAHVPFHDKEWLPYYCKMCDNMKITTGRVLSEHLRQHQEGLAVKCVYCERRFATLANCQAHERTHAAEKEADEIADAEKMTEAYDAKVVIENGIKRFQCEKCDRSYTLFSSLRKHQNLHTKSNAFICKTCGRAFVKASTLALHERRNHDEGARYNCEGCGKTFRTIGHLLDHRTRTQHFAGKPHICEGCTTTFREVEELEEHQKTCTEVEANRACFCGLCANDFPSLALALEHVKSNHEAEIPETKCRYCDLTFRDAEKIVEHEFRHTLPGIMSCTMCNRIFKHLKNLQCHVKNHGKAAIPFMCDICGKTFTQKGTLTIHTRLHTGERPYICQLCQKGFVDKNEMRRHYNMHFNAQSKLYIPNADQIAAPVDVGMQGKKYKQYACKICGRQLTTSTALAKHITTHTGEKKYQCDFCDKRFAQGGQLTVHRRIHTGERPFACETCGQRFVGGSNYKRHVKQRMCKPMAVAEVAAAQQLAAAAAAGASVLPAQSVIIETMSVVSEDQDYSAL
ncbi:zinc finger protein 420 [Aedes albopictus]|uniref:C2H2-type domain-containing protein n=1 Tax=Aedes albopictus TaxID=7160 RepID=A0ABM1YRV2_AEDAL